MASRCLRLAALLALTACPGRAYQGREGGGSPRVFARGLAECGEGNLEGD